MTRARVQLIGAGWLLAGLLAGLPAAGADLPPSPWAILGERHPPTPPLDPHGLCLPEDGELELGFVAESFATGDLGGAREALEALPAESPTRAIVAAMLAVASAEERAARLEAVSRLTGVLRHATATPLAVCGWIEAADAELALARHPEAVAYARRAARLAERLGVAPRLARAARFAQLEGLYASRAPSAAAGYESLAEGDDVVAHASRLRLLDLRLEAGDGPEVALYDLAIEQGIPDPLVRWHWQPRAAELAAAAGETEDALDRLASSRANLPASRQASVAAIREADLLVAADRPDAALERLRLAQSHEEYERVVQLARVREVALGVSPDPEEQQFARLEEVLAREVGGVRAHARAVQVEKLTAAGRLDEAVLALTALVFAQPPPEIVPDRVALVDRVLAAASAEAETRRACAPLVVRLGSSRNALMRAASVAEPFVRLAGCYQALGLAEPAVETYRAVARSFGANAAARVALPLASAAVEQGNLALARASAEAQIRRQDDDAAEWRLVLARVEQAEGQHRRALELLRPLVPLWEPVEDRMQPLALFARSAAAIDAAPAERAVLRFTLGSLPPAVRDRHRQQFGELVYLTADLYRQSGERDIARELYVLAGDYLETGPFVPANHYWIGNLEPGRSEARIAWQRTLETAEAEATGTGAWRALASGQLGASRLLELLGRARKQVEPEPAP